MAQAYSQGHTGSDVMSQGGSSSAGYAGYGAGGAGMAGLGAGLNAFPVAQPSGSSSGASSSQPMSALSHKQSEAYHEQQSFHVQNPEGPVTVHQDGGAFVEDAPASGNEIPPTYDSIRQ